MKQPPEITEHLSTGRPEELLGNLCRLAADRAPAEVEIPASFQTRNEAAEKQYQDVLKQITDRYESEKAATKAEYASVCRAAAERFESDRDALQKEYDEVRARVIARFEADESTTKQQLQEAQWEASTLSEAAQSGSELELKEIGERLDAQREELAAIHREAVEILMRRWQWRDYPKPEPADLPADGNPIRFVAESVSRAKSLLGELSRQGVPRMFEGVQPLGFFVFFLLISMVPAGFMLGWSGWYWVPASVLGAIVLTFTVGGWLFHVARRQSTQVYLDLLRTLAEADLARPAALKTAETICRRQNVTIVGNSVVELKKANLRFSDTMTEIHLRKQDELRETDEKYPARLKEIDDSREHKLKNTDEDYAGRLGKIDRDYKNESDRLHEQHARTMLENDRRRQREWSALSERWLSGIERFGASLDGMNSTCDRLFPDWSTADWDSWVSAAEVPPVVRFGTFGVQLGRLKDGLPRDDRLTPARVEFSMPALLPFPERSLLLLKAAGEGRTAAVELLQSVMLRMLTAMPPGKVRFTIIDPIGLGENFSAFMHLADYDEQLVASRIWTDAAHIERQLADLTEHMENVIQVYLRNEFDSIRDYNEFAGELAEPYRVLVIANFPANFTEAAAQRLKSIAASGGRCGVFTLLGVDAKRKMPRHFDLAGLLPDAMELRWSEGRFVCDNADFGELALSFDRPPSAERFTEIVRAVGSEVKDAERVEVPFECAAPDREQWWSCNSSEGIDVPLGRAGAMKLQHLNLGRGTSQHVLISGKTGSGKSTLLHALITNVALHYSPDQVELYLVDFKKGVEFKAYAESKLPHARVIAIESEREFGLSVLERLDEELRHRGDLFRKQGVQDLKGFRAAEPDVKMPRVLLIIDEFQELFVEDDRIAQDAALLLDRLVRQGRAFGIHVLLGSQTLAGAYSLARSTIGQMAVRIALQCSEADAHLILSEDNTAARLLGRPGEAIYNDTNGLYEGNHPFQVVWLPDHQRDGYLQQIRQLADSRRVAALPPIVFEGNVASDPGQNPLLHELIAAPGWPKASHAAQAWLGSAVAIKAPTAAVFVRQSGSNLLMVGHQEEEALGVLATCLVCLAAQHTPADPSSKEPGPRFYVLDGTRPDAPEAGFWHRITPVAPHEVKIVGPRDAAGAIAEIAVEATRRQETGLEDGPPIYLIVYNLGRFRDLRKADDEFSFSRLDEDKPPSPSSQLLEILREGPAFGIHTLMWCDTYNNVNRALDRQGLREMEMRVLFHVSAADSSNLIDTPVADRLGIHRALLYDEGQGRMEKFRPYGLPSDQWLDWVKGQLRGKG